MARVLKQDLNMSYKKAKKAVPQANSERCRVLRQQYALTSVEQLENNKRIINVDETWINETNFVRKIWSKKQGNTTLNASTISPRISMIAALDSDGQVWFSLTQTTTDSDVFMMFLQHLAERLDEEQPGWRENTVFLWDNAKYHNNNYTKS